MRSTRFFVALTLVALVAIACGGDDTPAADTGDTGGGAATLTASNFAFDPASLTAAAGSSVEFTNDDDVEHNFTAEDLGIEQDVEGGESATIDLGDAEPGTYDFFCKYHKDTMTGTIEITG